MKADLAYAAAEAEVATAEREVALGRDGAEEVAPPPTPLRSHIPTDPDVPMQRLEAAEERLEEAAWEP